jgi:cobalt-zinc-cadmium efflux system outer membrane protein
MRSRNLIRSILFSLLVTHSWLPTALASDDIPLSLEAAVDEALNTAPQIDAQTANLEAAQALTEGAGRLPDPELILGIDNLPVTGSDAYSTTSDFMTMRKIGVMQTFPGAKKRRLEHDQAEIQADVATAELKQTQLAIARTVAEAWIRRATAETSLAALRAIQPDVRLQAKAARAAVSAGRTSTADALLAETAVVQLANRVLALQSEAQRATLELAGWLGAEASRPLAPMPSLDELPTPAHALLASVHEHGSLLPFASRIEAARVDVDLAKAAGRADWSAELAFAKRGPDFSDMVSLEFRIGLPLWAKYRQNPRIAAKGAELRQLEADREVELRMHTAELSQMLVAWDLLGQQLEQYDQELLPLARERTRALLASYRAGRGDLPSALDAIARETDFVVEHAQLQNERGRVWAFLRYLGPQHLNP